MIVAGIMILFMTLCIALLVVINRNLQELVILLARLVHRQETVNPAPPPLPLSYKEP
jgi:hypothetical protein